MDRVGLRYVAGGAAVPTVGADGLPDAPSAVVDPDRPGGAGTALERGPLDARAEVRGRG
ncbi:hypothetical protein [Streptomyces viridosporus]|uniref:Predicted protein n=1 Tax=Streptomyces viridosporus (strain ATCC 14672 / DSM 40746 / JCM 4963 / KCTC 9882 / NRRL B-12104 / FH 1290) TaxID=566461 RepID=D6A2M9_STRV1|nr:hypothetical protein [Streptomyces viridosporus]EFE71467.1 predicted protein [Streptomyces viridosporus ATCC 14672]